jgi:hypothetical protein
MQPKGPAIMAQADPFASPAGGSGAASEAGRGMQDAFAAARQADYDGAAGVPKGRPPWMIAAAVGVAALVIGGGVALAFFVGK